MVCLVLFHSFGCYAFWRTYLSGSESDINHLTLDRISGTGDNPLPQAFAIEHGKAMNLELRKSDSF